MRSTSLLALLILVGRADAQTVLHSIPLPDAWDVATVGDLDQDGVADFVVGSPGTDNLGCSAGGGEVHVFSGSSGGELYSVQAPGAPLWLSAFGFSVDGVGDVNGDQRADFVVGAPKWSSTMQCGAGRAFVCSGLDGLMIHELLPAANTPNGYETFGCSVAGIGDANFDGIGDVAVGAMYGANPFGTNAGYVRIFSGLDGSVLHTIFGNWPAEQFGACCAAAGDVNGDGSADVLVGSPYHAYAGGVGAVRVYSGADGLLLSFVNGPAFAGIGMGVSSIGDVDADGVPDLAAGTGGSVRGISGRTGAQLWTTPARTLLDSGFGNIPLPHPMRGTPDVDGDGRPDVVVADTAAVRIVSGASGVVLFSHPRPMASAVGGAGDLNSDGHPDLVATTNAQPAPLFEVVLTSAPAPLRYCTPKLNSIGCLPTIYSEGVLSMSVGNDDFHVRAVDVRNLAPGLLLWSFSSNSAPFYGGTLCIGAGIRRTAGQFSLGTPTGLDCSGTFDFHFSRQYAWSQGIFPSTHIFAQYWSRDSGWSPPNNVSLTDGLSFWVLP